MSAWIVWKVQDEEKEDDSQNESDMDRRGLLESLLRGKRSPALLFSLLATVRRQKVQNSEGPLELKRASGGSARASVPKHRMRQSLTVSYSSERLFSWPISAFCFQHVSYVQCFFFFFFFKWLETEACCYETYRMWREGRRGGGGSWAAVINKQKMQRTQPRCLCTGNFHDYNLRLIIIVFHQGFVSALPQVDRDSTRHQIKQDSIL